MTNRRYGFEIESKLIKQNNPRIYVGPTFPDNLKFVEQGDTVLDKGKLGKRLKVFGGTEYKELYTFWGDWEISTDPTKDRTGLTAMLKEGYDLAMALPCRYKPWFEYTQIELPHKLRSEKSPADEKRCKVVPSKLDVSVQVNLHELGLTTENVPPPKQMSKFNGEWWLNELPVRNSEFIALIGRGIYGNHITCQLRKIGDAYVLEASFNMMNSMQTKENVVDIATTFINQAVTSLVK